MYDDPAMLLMMADSIYADRLAQAQHKQQLAEARETAQPVVNEGSAPMRVWIARRLMTLADHLAPRTPNTRTA